MPKKFASTIYDSKLAKNYGYKKYKIQRKIRKQEPNQKPTEKEIKQLTAKYFKKDIKKLEKLINRNLSFWYNSD